MENNSELREHLQISVEWKIKKFFDLPKEIDHSLKSHTFTFFKTRWHFEIYPNGESAWKSSGWLGAYLWKEKTESEHHVFFRLEIKNVNDTVNTCSGTTEHTFSINSGRSGWCKFMKRSKLLSSDVASDGILTVICTIGMVDKFLVSSSTKNASQTQLVGTREVASQSSPSDDVPNLCKDLEALYISKHFTDVTVKVNDREFPAHRNILAARSTVFASMFQHDTEEKRSGKVEIPDCDSETFENFLLFLYTGKLYHVTPRIAVSLYETCDKYDVQALKVECVRCMTHGLTVDSFCDVFRLSCMYNEIELLKIATEFSISNTRNILMSTKWHTFISENPLVGNELLLQIFK